MNEDDILPEVTAIVKYDLYPYYLVVKGKLSKFGGIKLGGASHYRPESVIKVLPASEYDSQKDTLKLIRQVYDEKECQLRVDILKQHGVHFVKVK